MTVALAEDDRILNGAVINHFLIEHDGLIQAAVRTIRDLLNQEIAMTEALGKAPP